MSSKALLVIDVQNDYFAGGAYPLWQADQCLANILTAIGAAESAGLPVVFVQHVGSPASPFFKPGTAGCELHPAILEKARQHGRLVQKKFADAFDETTLEAMLGDLGTQELILCGMMTQNCVTHTALSGSAAKFQPIRVIAEACTSDTQMTHAIALNALSRRVQLVDVAHALE